MRPKRRIGKAKSAMYAKMAVKPTRSLRIYLRVAPKDLAYFKFILETYDNLAYLSVVDRHAAIAQIVYTKGMAREVRSFLDGMHEEVEFTEISFQEYKTETRS